MKKLIYIFFISMSIFHNVWAQEKKVVTGTVYDAATKVPLEGVTIRIKGNNLSAVTGPSGQFSLRFVTAKNNISFSHVGYQTTEYKLNENTPTGISIFMTVTTVVMKEVTLSTGYQEISKISTTGSYEKIDSTLFNRSVTTDVLSRLDGVSSSIYFNKMRAKPEIFIRGISTISAGTAPLVVLDNFPYEGDINNINPNDVESITILKDAASAAIWGAKAGNGVIVITTKKGRYGQKPQLVFNANITTQQKTNIFKDRFFINASDFIDLEKFLFTKGRYDADLNNTSSRVPVSPVVELLAKARAGLLSQSDADTKINLLRGQDIRNDYSKYFYQTSINRQYALSLSGGSGTVNYIFSGGLDKNAAVIKNNDNQRITFFTGINVIPVKNIEIHAGINYTASKTNNNGLSSINPGNGKTAIYPYARLTDDNGNSISVEKGYRQGFTDTAGAGLLLDWKYRPLDELNLNDNSIRSQDILFKGSVVYHFTSSLNINFSGQLEKVNGDSRNLYNKDIYFARDLINRFSQRTGANTIKRNIPLGGILDETKNELSAYGLRAQVNYAKQFRKWDINIIGGGEVRESHTTSVTGRTYGYDDNILTYQNVDYLSNFPLFGNLGTAAIVNSNNFEDGTSRYISAYFNSSLSYKNKYILSASARKDASNLFGVNTNQKWNPLWSAGFAWNISQENFYHSGLLPFLKARISYGYNGNIRSDLSALATISYQAPSIVTNLIFVLVNNAPNPDLTWEKSGIMNAGIDFAIKDKVVEGSIEYYHKNCVDLLSLSPLDPTSGLSQMTLNAANISGKGIDVKLNTKIIDRKLKVGVDLLFSYVTNRILQYKLQNATKAGYAGGGDGIVAIEGKDPYALISFRWGGLDPVTGDPMGYIGDTLSKNYSAIVSSSSWDNIITDKTARPPYYGNIIPTVSFRGLSLSFNISYKFGYYFRRTAINYSTLFSTWLGDGEYIKRWQKPGDEAFTNVPSLVYPANTSRDKFYSLSEATVERGDHIRLQDINAAYTFATIKHFCKSLQLYSYINNVAILWRANKLGLDPNYGSQIPPEPKVSFGIKATF
jgi:TonB-linked SusC/RagA family outer membrane protein